MRKFRILLILVPVFLFITNCGKSSSDDIKSACDNIAIVFEHDDYMYTSHWSNDSLDSPHLTESFVEVKGYVHKVITALDESLSIISESAQKDNNAKKIFSLMFAYRDSNSSYLNVASETSYSRDYLYSYDEPSIREKLEVQCAIYTIGENK